MDTTEKKEPDFAVRNLADYTPDDLDLLLRGVRSAYRQAKEWERTEDANALDIWCYRIGDALKEAKKNTQGR